MWDITYKQQLKFLQLDFDALVKIHLVDMNYSIYAIEVLEYKILQRNFNLCLLTLNIIYFWLLTKKISEIEADEP